MDTTAGSFHLSPQQEDLWSREPEGPRARVQGTLSLEPATDLAATVRAALEALVSRHEILRTTFVRQPGLRLPLQLIADAAPAPLAEVSLPADPAQAAQAREQALRAERGADFDFSTGPLLRALLLTGGSRPELVLTISSLCADPASLALALGEVRAACGGGGEPIEDPLQYADFAAWQRELLESDEDEARAAVQRWGELADPSYPELPFAGKATFDAAEEAAVPIAAGVGAEVGSAAARYGVDAATFVQAAWHVLLARYSLAPLVTVATLAGERRHGDLEGAVGAFARTVPITVTMGAQASFAEVLHATGRLRDEALTLQDYRAVADDERPACAYVAVDAPALAGADWSLAVSGVAALWLVCLSAGDELRLSVGYDPGAHAPDSVAQLAAGLGALLAAAAAAPDTAVAALPALDDAQRSRLLADFAGPVLSRPQTSVAQLIAARALDGPAVIDQHGTLTHAELQARAAQLAHELAHRGVTPGDRVGLCTDRSADMVVGVVGILMAGAAYVPLHPEHPQARLHQQLAGAGARVVVTQQGLRERVAQDAGEVVCLDSDRSQLDAHPASAPDIDVAPDSLAYVIYTSGSTGTPKGVGVTHANLVNYALDLIDRVGAASEPLRFAMVTSLATDLGNTSLFGALCSGGTLVLPSADAAGDPGALAELFARAGVDVLKITPSHLAALLAGGEARILPTRTLILGGERAPWDLIATVRALASPRILNHYGPTEATIGCCVHEVGEDPGPWRPASVPIGRPITNANAYLLDPHRALVPVGVPGQLFIGGAGVASGYVGQVELTAQRFVENPFAPGERVYDTGDLARWLPDGTLEFLGRADDQIKIRGYRVEPGEIESALRDHPAVSEAVVLAESAAGSEPRLLAYCGAPGAPGAPSAAELRAHLEARLPEHMVPGAIMVLERLPRTPSGKIDRQALPDPDVAADAEYLAPRTPMEQAVAAIWSQVLGLDRVGVQDDFFSLGGHSLLATQVVAQVRSDFAVDLPLHSLFTHPTVAALTDEIVGLMGAADDDTARLLAELDGMSDEEAERLLRGDRSS